ncbi:MAG: hypothetical protein JWM25_131 [Thermoleophilia bacterium]|nr:hypothetical protein [Thermoleophilia bacterium]
MIRDAHGAPDLAELVLADARVRGKRAQGGTASGTASGTAWAPASVPTSTGHDPRSILILAIVVATLAMVIAWTASFGGDDGGPLEATRSTPKQDVALAGAGATLPATPAADAAPAPIVGIDLQVGRVTTSVSAGQATVRVGVRNAGTLPHAGGTGAQLLVLLDGARVGASGIGAIAANGAATVVDVPLYSCSSGAHSLVVVADVAGVVREADERNNAQALPTSFSC